MQFAEANSFELASAVHELEHRDDPLRFVLFPMIHIGEREYYEDIAARASRCDVLLAEGVPSIWARIATLSYELFAARLGLVTQRELKLKALGPKIVNADMSADEFDEAHSQLPFFARAILPLALPLHGLHFLFRGSREHLARQLETTDLPPRERVLEATEETDALDRLLVARRDRAFLERLDSFIQASRSKPLKVGIVYGASHMPAIFRHLSRRYGYRVKSSGWTRVFSLP
ncbi:MAG: hypothetical protein MJE66_16765 [Proteobacteria bacterium]|nr:hypothetical protein [Pseudomonadota bacterium]